MKQWTTDFPTKPGWYWFYGYRYGRISCGYEETPRLMTVMVSKSGSNDLMYVANGNFMYESEVEDAHFKKLDAPALTAKVLNKVNKKY
jgi:hypothetical protein